MRKVWMLPVLLIGVGGCATTYTGPGVNAALSDCELQADMLPVTANPALNPFAVAAFQEDFINRCMRAKGYTAS